MASKRELVSGKYLNKTGVTPGGRKYQIVKDVKTGKTTTHVRTPGERVRYVKSDGTKQKFTGTKNSPDMYGGYKEGAEVSKELKKPMRKSRRMK